MSRRSFGFGAPTCVGLVGPAAASLLCMGIVGFAGPAWALNVIHDSGDTVPIAPYLAPLREDVGPDLDSLPDGMTSNGSSSPSDVSPPSGPIQFDVRRLLPIRSPGLEPGSLAGRSLSPAVAERLSLLSFPVFVVGADRLSLEWLGRNRMRLKAIGAWGLLVQAETEADLLAVARAGFGLNIAPVPGAELVRELGLSRYPVLISSEGLMQ